MEIRNKKGVSMVVVLTIIGIVSFIIILFLIFRLNLGGTTNQQICMNSVLQKEKFGLASPPLDCKINYLCISGGEDCEEISATEKIEVDTENKNETMKALADEMAGCWNMFGEGKADYVDEGAFTGVACAICSIVDFDDAIKADVQSISYLEFYDYLRKTKKTNSQTYLQYLYPTGEVTIYKEASDTDNYFNNVLEFDKTYSILTGEAEQGFLTPRLKIWDTKFTPLSVIILENTNENYEKLGCGEFLTKA